MWLSNGDELYLPARECLEDSNKDNWQHGMAEEKLFSCHFTIPGFLLLILQVSLSLPAALRWMGSISSVPVH